MAVSLAGGLSTVLATLFALSDESATAAIYGNGTCAPSAAQAAQGGCPELPPLPR